ncbi:hypothetical protein OHS18_44780 [Amycolatopsis sp. NBC_00355]|uniref:hypothetical protein n=1 Tax=Amycolatopsis sp. NBC_00355 TaxID=2975957 RepID=UPI002E26C1D6
MVSATGTSCSWSRSRSATVGLGSDGKYHAAYNDYAMPFDTATGRPKPAADGLVHERGASSPVWGMQGAVSRGGYFVLTGVCPGRRR